MSPPETGPALGSTRMTVGRVAPPAPNSIMPGETAVPPNTVRTTTGPFAPANDDGDDDDDPVDDEVVVETVHWTVSRRSMPPASAGAPPKATRDRNGLAAGESTLARLTLPTGWLADVSKYVTLIDSGSMTQRRPAALISTMSAIDVLSSAVPVTETVPGATIPAARIPVRTGGVLIARTAGLLPPVVVAMSAALTL
jgi:hypothetical protein